MKKYRFLIIGILLLLLVLALSYYFGTSDFLGTSQKKDSVEVLFKPSDAEIYSHEMMHMGVTGKDAFVFYRYKKDSGTAHLTVSIISDTFPFTLYKNKRIFQGDIILGEPLRKLPDSAIDAFKKIRGLEFSRAEAFIQLDKSLPQISQLDAVGEKTPNHLWKDNQVHFKISSSLERERVLDAIDLWKVRLGGVITFLEIPPGETRDNFVHFVLDEGYSSEGVGMKGGEQQVTVDAVQNIGKIAHEVGHVLGLWHEHSHPSRDKYISLVTENIEPSELAQFCKKDPTTVDTSHYDLNSIMHYDRNAFAKNGNGFLITIQVSDAYSHAANAMGQRSAPSERDIEMIKHLYQP